MKCWAPNIYIWYFCLVRTENVWWRNQGILGVGNRHDNSHMGGGARAGVRSCGARQRLPRAARGRPAPMRGARIMYHSDKIRRGGAAGNLATTTVRMILILSV